MAAEWNNALRIAFAQLPARRRELLSMLMQDPPPADTAIGGRLGIPVDGIGPNRARCLARMRRWAPAAVLLDAESEGRGGKLDG